MAPAPQGPSATGAPIAIYRVRVFYPTRHAKSPRVSVVSPVQFVA